MTRHGEDLDDTIDRVAAAITYVPADPALAGRVAERIGHAPDVFAWRGLVAGVVGVAAVAIVVALVTSARQESVGTPLVTTPAPVEPAPLLAEATPEATPTDSAVDAVRPRHAAPPARSRVAEIAGGVPQIAALPLPALLAVPDLPTAALTIEPVDFAPLDLANLAVAEIEDRNEPKE